MPGGQHFLTQYYEEYTAAASVDHFVGEGQHFSVLEPFITISGNQIMYFTVGLAGFVPFYRLYNQDQNDHFYTTDEAEKKTANTNGYRDEGLLGFLSLDVLHVVDHQRACAKCGALFSDQEHGACAGGEDHKQAADGHNYWLTDFRSTQTAIDAASGTQGGWRRCLDCNALSFASLGGARSGVCAKTNQAHRFDMTISAHALPWSAKPTAGTHLLEWRYCYACDLLVHPNKAGFADACHAKGHHDVEGSGYYPLGHDLPQHTFTVMPQLEPLYRCYNEDLADHFYTKDSAEAAAAASTAGYVREDSPGFVFPVGASDYPAKPGNSYAAGSVTPVYRTYIETWTEDSSLLSKVWRDVWDVVKGAAVVGAFFTILSGGGNCQSDGAGGAQCSSQPQSG